LTRDPVLLLPPHGTSALWEGRSLWGDRGAGDHASGRACLHLAAASDRLPDGNGALRVDAREPARRLAHCDSGPRCEAGGACGGCM